MSSFSGPLVGRAARGGGGGWNLDHSSANQGPQNILRIERRGGFAMGEGGGMFWCAPFPTY